MADNFCLLVQCLLSPLARSSSSSLSSSSCSRHDVAYDYHAQSACPCRLQQGEDSLNLLHALHGLMFASFLAYAPTHVLVHAALESAPDLI